MGRDYIAPPFGGVLPLDAYESTSIIHKSQDVLPQKGAHPTKKVAVLGIESFPDRLRVLLGDDSALSFARKAGVSDSALHKWLNRKSMPTLDNLAAIASAGNVNVGWLASGEGPMQGSLLPVTVDRVQPVGFVTEGDATVRIPIYDGLSAGPNGGLEALGHILGFGDFFLDWIRYEARIDPKRAFAAPVRGDSMMNLLYDGDLVLGELQDFIDRDGIYAVSLNDQTLIKHVSQGPRRGDVTLTSENTKYPPRVASEANGDVLQPIGRIARRLTGLTSTPL